MLLDLLAAKREMKAWSSSNLLLIPLVLVFQQGLHQLAGLVPEVVIAHVHLDFAVINVHNVGADRVEEVAVVGDHNHGAGEVQEEIL